MSLWRNELESWLSTIEVSGSVLDVGGKQKLIQGRTKTWDVDEYAIVDLPEFDLSRTMTPELMIEVKKYRNVFCLETVMYTTDPAQAIKNLVWMTTDNLYITNPLEGYGETKPEGTDMHRLFPNWWKAWLDVLGMEIVEMKIVYPGDHMWSLQATKNEGYKMIRPHASGILIHAKKI